MSVFPPHLSQERLLLSLLPAHIAMEMKAEIIQRLQGPKAGQMENTNNFHNLYVKRHTNVRCAALFLFFHKPGEPVAFAALGTFSTRSPQLTMACLLVTVNASHVE